MQRVFLSRNETEPVTRSGYCSTPAVFDIRLLHLSHYFPVEIKYDIVNFRWRRQETYLLRGAKKSAISMI